MQNIVVDSEVLAECQAVLDKIFHKKPVDPEVSRRVHERAEQIRERLRRNGPRNIAAGLLRQSRDDV